MSRTQKVLDEVLREREKQIAQWDHEHDADHTWAEWVGLIRKWLDRSLGSEKETSFRRGMIVVASLAVAAIEAHDREVEYEGKVCW